MPATSTEVPATQTKYKCPDGWAAATRYSNPIMYAYGWGGGSTSQLQVDRDVFQSGGDTYRYDRESKDTSRVCVQQGQAAGD